MRFCLITVNMASSTVFLVHYAHYFRIFFHFLHGLGSRSNFQVDFDSVSVCSSTMSARWPTQHPSISTALPSIVCNQSSSMMFILLSSFCFCLKCQCPRVQEPKKPLGQVFKVVTTLFSVSYEILSKKSKRKPETLYIYNMTYIYIIIIYIKKKIFHVLVQKSSWTSWTDFL